MSRRLDIGISSYNNWPKLHQCLQSIRKHSTTDWRCFVVDNQSTEDKTREIIARFAADDSRIVPIWMDSNSGYVGAVNKLFEIAQTEYIAYSDNDVTILTAGWDESMCKLLDRFHEVGMVFSGGGAYPLNRGAYDEIMWGVGCFWVINRLCQRAVGDFDASLGHQEEADYCLRVRMAGWRCAACREVGITHVCSATHSPEAQERINRGVVNWVNKWTAYFGGKSINYHSPNTIRWEDWHPNALYLEEYWKKELGDLNATPETFEHSGRTYDLIRVPRLSCYYRNRII